MGKYQKFEQKPQKKHELHPVWRGIGCILFVVIPLIAYFLMLLVSPFIIATGYVPYQLLGFVHFPDWMFKTQITSSIALYIGSIENLWANLVIFIVILVLLAGVVWLLYSAIYDLVGPARYTELDAPPSKYKAKKYTR
jgi:hypothetical protein